MISYETSSRFTDAMLAKAMLGDLDMYYPDFGHWYVNKCVPGIVLGNDKMIVARDGAQIVGVALGKKTAEEVKLRCVRVLPSYQQRGTGIHLIERMLRSLDSSHPHCTVAEEMIHLYSRAFVNHFNFDLSHVDKGRYRTGKLEYVFNDPNHNPKLSSIAAL